MCNRSLDWDSQVKDMTFKKTVDLLFAGTANSRFSMLGEAGGVQKLS